MQPSVSHFYWVVCRVKVLYHMSLVIVLFLNLESVLLRSLVCGTRQAIAILIYLSTHYNDTGVDEVHSLWDIICDPFLEAIQHETEHDVLLVMMESLCKVCSHVSSGYILIHYYSA